MVHCYDNVGLMDMVVKVELRERCTLTVQMNQDQQAKPNSKTSSILQSPKWGLIGHEYSLHLQNQDREPKFGTWDMGQMTISKSR